MVKKIESKAIDFRDKHLIQVPNADFPLSAILSVKFKNSRGVEYNYELNKKQSKETVDKVKTADTKTEMRLQKKQSNKRMLNWIYGKLLVITLGRWIKIKSVIRSVLLVH